MKIPTEPIGSIPRPPSADRSRHAGGRRRSGPGGAYDAAVRDTVKQFEATGSPVITDGEQWKYHNFWTYSVHGLANTAADGFKIPFVAGHTRRMPRLTGGPFRYRRYADVYLKNALRYARAPVKQAVISPSALSLMYPETPIPGYAREEFIDDLIDEHELEVRNCLAAGAHCVQVDFTEGRLAVKIDPSGDLLHSFIDLNNLALARFSAEERATTRRAHVPRRRPRFDAQRRRRLRRPAAEPVRARRAQLLYRTGRRARPKAGPRDHQEAHEAAPPHLHRRRRADRPARGDARRRSAIAFSKPPRTFPRTSSGPPTIAASPRSATTPPLPGTRRS